MYLPDDAKFTWSFMLVRCRKDVTMAEKLDVLTAADVFREFGLESESVEREAEGRGNRAYLTNRFVVRIAKDEYSQYLDHTRECQIAKAMLEVGVRTARPVAWTQWYSVLERVPGKAIERGERASDEVWNALLDDLEHVWSNPAEPMKPLESWSQDGSVLERPSVQEALTIEERDTIERIITKPRAIQHATFIHGDAFNMNVMVHEGAYSAVIDWGWSGWHPLEHEFAMLNQRALELGLERHSKKLDLPLLGAIRLNIGLEVASYGLIDWAIVRQGLREALEYGA
jgi:aminoglycoside phosphotransferase (APT) family kinase protein